MIRRRDMLSNEDYIALADLIGLTAYIIVGAVCGYIVAYVQYVVL